MTGPCQLCNEIKVRCLAAARYTGCADRGKRFEQAGAVVIPSHGFRDRLLAMPLQARSHDGFAASPFRIGIAVATD